MDSKRSSHSDQIGIDEEDGPKRTVDLSNNVQAR